MVRSLREIIQKLRKLPQGETNLLNLLAAEALSATLDEKLIRAGSLQDLTEQLAETIELFPPSFPMDDLRYRLAHLHMRVADWEKADNQLLELKDSYYSTEAQIYAALCAVKLDCKNPLISEIAKRLRQSPPEQKDKFRSFSVQEHHYNLLEILVYAADLKHEDLAPYYETGSTQADLQIKSSFPEYQNWIPIARFRLQQLLQHSQGFLILNCTKDKISREFETQLRPPVKKLAEKLARKYPSWIEKSSLEEELKDHRISTNQRPATLSEWKRKLCDALNNPDAVSICDAHDPVEPTKYRLEHPFLLIRQRLV